MAASSARPGPKPRLTIDAIAGATVEIADAAGLDAVSMARVADRVGSATMALYRHVPTKSALIALAVDAAIGRPPAVDETDWHESLRTWATRCLRAFRRHPWLLAATSQAGREMGGNERLWVGAALAALAPTGLTDAQQRDFTLALLGQVRAVAQFAEHPRQLDLGVRCLLDGLHAVVDAPSKTARRRLPPTPVRARARRAGDAVEVDPPGRARR